MTHKKIISMIMTLVLLLSVVAPCLSVMGTGSEAHSHDYGQWVLDQENGTQSRTCTTCNHREILYGTDTKVSQAENPAVGESYYLAANVAGTVYFFRHGTVSDTQPYSLVTTDNVNHNWAFQVTLETPVEGNTGFQMTYKNPTSGATTRIYCYDVLTTGENRGIMDTGANTANFINRHTFFVDEVGGVKVLRKIGNNHVLVVKYDTVKGEYRMLGVPESELSNAGVYPAMLVNVHNHSYGEGYDHDQDGHWKTCDCGSASEKESHSFVMDEELGYEVCACGADLKVHVCENTDGKWQQSETGHSQHCSECGKLLQEGDHTFGPWSFDEEAGLQTRICTVCGFGDHLYGTDIKAVQVKTPAVGESYYLAANTEGTIRFFVLEGSVTDTSPYSLHTTSNMDNTNLQKVTLETPVSGDTGFQITFLRQSDNKLLRIYCYDASGNDGIMDTGTNATNELEKHTFYTDVLDGVTVLRKYGNNNILAVKYNSNKGEYRMLGVPESELGAEGVYPAMLVDLHTHSFGEAYGFDQSGHWHTCECGTAGEKEEHNYVLDETLGYEVCACGADLKPHVCESADGKWFAAGENHYQLCGGCGQKIGEEPHAYASWSFDTENGVQSRACSVCQFTQTLHGTDNKVFQAENPTAGQSYYLAANAAGTIYYFVLEGSVTVTTPYSLFTTSNFNNANLRPVTLESPVSGDTGFQITFLRPSDDKLLRIYCYDAGGSDGIMDTGTNAGNELEKHTFYVDTFNGVKVLRKTGNNNILALKYNADRGEYRMLGVPESELGTEGVYPAMLVTAHDHSYGQEYAYDQSGHWHVCDCGAAGETETHNYVENDVPGYAVCVCGAELKPHTCESTDGKWYASGQTHYQLCYICNEKINETEHTYGDWFFDSENGTQNRVCTACGYTQILWGTDIYKVSPAENPLVGESYYLAANVDGSIQFFRHGQVTDTTPCSLWATEDFTHSWVFPVTVEAPVEGDAGFQMVYENPSTSSGVRIYCYDSVGSDGIMDTGTNATNEFAKHTFYVDEIDGVKVLRKTGNNHILVAKYNESKLAYRILGVPESELGSEGVYPVMLTTVHQHSYTDTTYHSDALGHWYACQCGGKSNYAAHTVSKWEYTTVPTQTTPGSKTGVCTLCGATAVVDIPPVVAEGYYYLTGTVDGVTYYFREKTGTESVEHTVPFSLLTTDRAKNAMQVNILWDEKTNTYMLTYFTTRQLNIYMGDVNGSTVSKDGFIDLASSATTSEDLIAFRWDPENGVFYQMENGVKYVIAFRRMTLTDGETQAVRMLAVPESELEETTAVMKLDVIHEHSYSEKWGYDAVSHWHECSCGTRKEEAAHQIDSWKTEVQATKYSAGRKSGVCSLCGQKIVNAIPMLNDHVQAPANGSQYYLIGVLNGNCYYFSHAPSGVSVTDTIPYGLVTVTKNKANMLTVKVVDGKYNLIYGSSNYHIYMNANGVGVTSNASNKDLVDFLWDGENKLLYQIENGVKCVLVFKTMRNNKTGASEVRVTFMPMDQALIDPSVAIAQFSTQAPPQDEKPKKEPVVFTLPEDATPLETMPYVEPPVEEIPLDDAISPRNLVSLPQDMAQDHAQADAQGNNRSEEQNGGNELIWAIVISAGAVSIIAVLLILLRNTKFMIFFAKKWNWWTAVAFVIAAAVLVTGMLLYKEPETVAPQAEGISMQEFTIVANAGNLDLAGELAVAIYEDYGISLPVVQSKDYEGNMGIYLDTQGLNSYGGYKYSVYSRDNEYGQGIYINGSGASLETAISKWRSSVKNPYSFPFGLQEDISGYEWNTEDINMTSLGFSLKETESRQLHEGVELRKLKYESFGYGKVTGYAVIVDSDADVELKVAAGAWDENTTPENPGEKHTVGQYGKMLTEEGYEVLAITNAGFYDLNTTMTYIPWGLQIVDGSVKKEPNEENPNNTDNWFGQTADGKYVISNTAGYYETYETTIAQGVGGGRVLMRDGKPCFSTTGADYRTVVGITRDGDLVILTVPSANYAFVAQIFMDMNVDIDCVLNLDGGGSTTLHSLDEDGNLMQYVCETPIEREVADAIAIVKKN